MHIFCKWLLIALLAWAVSFTLGRVYMLERKKNSKEYSAASDERYSTIFIVAALMILAVAVFARTA